MGNKLSSSPFPSYETASTQYSATELRELKSKFEAISHCQGTITTASFAKRPAAFGSYAQRHVHPRIFNTFDTKRDGSIDFEEYLCGVTVFRNGSAEDKFKCIYLMYEGNKSGSSLTKDNFRQLLVDASLCAQKNDLPAAQLDAWLLDMKQLAQGMAEAAFVQYATNLNKMEVHEFIAFAKSNESSVLTFVPIVVALFDS